MGFLVTGGCPVIVVEGGLEKQIPCGDDKKKGKSNDEAWRGLDGGWGGESGFLHSAVHGETVSSFGRNDNF